MSSYLHGTLFLFFFFVFHATIIPLACSELSPNQKKIMNNISKKLNVSKWDTKNQDPCVWEGVNCSGNSITRLSFSKFGISDTSFLVDLCELDSLQILDLSNNQIGSIPGEFLNGCSKINGLNLLNFSNNRLSGSLPTFTGFSGLSFLDLSFNSLSGIIDLQLDGFVSIRSLNLSGNTFSGALPTHFGKEAVLEELQLSRNNFTGQIPKQLFKYTNLIFLDLSSNQLSGPFPFNLRDLLNLEILILSSNNLEGEIPLFHSKMKNLWRFSANQNRFSGKIPPGITQNLRILDLSYNNLSGVLPEDLLSAPNLGSIDLTSNHLEGAIPTDISNKLFRLRLSNNLLKGSIPSSVGSLSDLMYLELEGNQLTGNIPLELENCEKLTLLNLARNQLNGSLSTRLGNLLQLVVVTLNGNQLSGEIPAEISLLKNLSKINISRNSLTGEIPSGITNLRDLSNLNLEGNRLNGSIPPAISNMSALLELQLGSNRLSGDIPRMPSSLQIALNLSNNQFGGRIPSSLGELSNLEVLDLSNNQLTGEVPPALSRLWSLTLLVLSNNRLSGTLPSFNSATKVEYSGNKDLKNETSNPSTNPSTNFSRKKSNPSTLVILVAVAGAILTIGMVAVILIVYKRFYQFGDDSQGLEENLPQVINGHFITKDNIQRSSIDFPRAMEAVSNPVNIMLKSRFSTYYKALMPCGRSYCVKKLNWSDKIFQLGSHDKFGEGLEMLGRMNNSRIMIPLAYVLTADNAYLFYEHSHMGTLFYLLHGNSDNSLDWTCRYSIALGVAQGLSFLHGCTDPVLLLDLSTKTILLRSLIEPQIADVEISKVIDPSKSTGSLSTIAGSVGYIPPEYAYTMRVTMAGNVYSFGVVLLELLTGKPSVSQGTELAKWVLSNLAQGNASERILDSNISKTSPAVLNQMLSVLKTAQACVSVSPDARPKMKNVVRMLLNAR